MMTETVMTDAAKQGDGLDAERWRAVLTRDARADGAFFYSVRTTGVYCRPSCASRRPRREHVEFHPTTQAAERAGFRPCKRCRPTGASLAARRAAAVAGACRRIERADEMPSLDALARNAGMSRFHFHRVFRSIAGVTPRAYAAAHRARRVRRQLRHTNTVTEAIYEAGFNSSGRFYAAAASILGMTPTTFRSGGAGETIHFAVGRSSLGCVLVGATDKGICTITLGDHAADLTGELQKRFPRASLLKGGDEFEGLIARVIRLVEEPAAGCDLPLDVRGTAFQQRVWQELRAIPPGSTVSYTEVARRIGAPAAVRGVAQACAANPVAMAIPCHRVVRADGTLAGYRWGIERKRALLERETVASDRASRSSRRS
jgi:AraC family transcriptional regulator of adaptative response/methylated-DNA-[protein]-cysteine methyltransferase